MIEKQFSHVFKVSFVLLTQISSNGLISFGSPYTAFRSRTFPITQRVISPYWNDHDLRNKGIIIYFSITPTHSTHEGFLDYASDFISDIEDIDFEASWMLVVRWIDVCPYGNNRCTQASSLYDPRITLFIVNIYTGKQLPGCPTH